MLILLAGLFLALLPFLAFLAPIIIWAALPLLALFIAVYVAHAVQRRRHMPALAHQR
jgi:hypothetical protein